MIDSLPDIGPCIKWIGCYNSSGYGQIFAEGKSWTASAYLYHLYHRNDRYEVVDHLCDNEWCISLYHLEGVSNKENQRRRRANKYCKKCGGELTYYGLRSRGRCCRPCTVKYNTEYLKQYRLAKRS